MNLISLTTPNELAYQLEKLYQEQRDLSTYDLVTEMHRYYLCVSNDKIEAQTGYSITVKGIKKVSLIEIVKLGHLFLSRIDKVEFMMYHTFFSILRDQLSSTPAREPLLGSISFIDRANRRMELNRQVKDDERKSGKPINH